MTIFQIYAQGSRVHMNKKPLVAISHLSVSYHDQEAVSDISFEIYASDFVGLAGPNGAGKTTLLRTILGLEKPTHGSVSLFGKDQKEFRAWHTIGYLPQQKTSVNHLLPATVEEVVALSIPDSWDGIKVRESVRVVLNDLGIAHLSHKLFSTLSGGQKQRVLLARSLVTKPALLFLDEPSAALDPQARDSFFALLKKLNKEQGTAIVLVTHDAGYVGAYANKLLYIDTHLIYFGDFAHFCQSEQMNEHFGPHDHHIICHQHA